LTVAPGQAATALGIAAPTDPNYIASQLIVTVTALPTDGTVDMADGVTPITLNQLLSVTELTSLTFLPMADVADTTSSLGYTVTDPANNSTTGSFALNVAAEAPVLPAAPVITTPKEIVDTPNPTITGTALAGSIVTVFADGLAAGTATASAAGTFTETLSTPLAIGLHSITATATASAGASAMSTALNVFTIESPGADGVVSSDYNSLQIGMLQAQGYVLGLTPSTESVALVDGTLSLKADTNEAMLQRFYQGLLGRPADAGGLAFWDNLLDSGDAAGIVAGGILATPEYIATHTSMTDTQFVSSLYQGFLGRAPDAEGQAFYSGLLSAGTSRGDVVASIADSVEAKAVLAASTTPVWVPSPEGTIGYEAYQTGLGREIDLPSLTNVETNLRGGLTTLQLFQQIAASPEFAALHGGQDNGSYVASLYQAGLGRAPDVSGAAFFNGLLTSGAGTRVDVFLDIASSQEAAAHLTRSLVGT
jgi:hypothetical protein